MLDYHKTGVNKVLIDLESLKFSSNFYAHYSTNGGRPELTYKSGPRAERSKGQVAVEESSWHEHKRVTAYEERNGNE